jgi:hypothetical protein
MCVSSFSVRKILTGVKRKGRKVQRTENLDMPIRKSSSPKTYARSLNPALVCKRVQVRCSAALSGQRDAFQVFDGNRKLGQHARNPGDAWANAYGKQLNSIVDRLTTEPN